jgi:hypothetical protein
VVASLLPVVAVGKEHSCTAAARTTTIGIVVGCPNTAVVEVNAADPWVGYTPCGT